MIFVIGGYAQGKTAWAADHYPEAGQLLVDDWARETFRMRYEKEQKEPEVIAAELWEQLKRKIQPGSTGSEAGDGGELVVISREIGNGIVPMEKSERIFRECLGRLQIQIAAEAHTVVRVCCGIGIVIKG